MATLNDFKLLQNKCINMFNMVSISTIENKYISSLSDVERARFGFYYFVIQVFTTISEAEDITECICDQDFCAKFYQDPQPDEGIDAVCIDDETHEIHVFNFKYRKDYNSDKEQSKNEAWQSSKFFTCLLNENTDGLSDRMKCIAQNVLERYNRSEIWQTHFYVVSNENKELRPNDLIISQMQSTFDLQVHAIGLNQIVPFLTATHKEINATLLMPTDAVMSFTEQELSSEKSYIVRMSLPELIRITCTDEQLRSNYSLEDYSELQNATLDYDVLFDNVRGYILNSKFNSNIATTIVQDPTKFFLYNNGLTIVAENITSSPVNGNKKWKLEIKNFQVLNGGQTLRTIHNVNKENSANMTKSIVKAEVLVRVLNVTDPNLENCIAEYTNSQNAIDLIDLKSLRKEQIDIETLFRENGILYTRKKGMTDVEMRNAKFQIGIQRLGQILTSVIRKRPEESSNKKREIFSTHYDELFVNNLNLISNYTIQVVNDYHNLRSEYRVLKRKYTEQKAMYILFMRTIKPSLSVAEAINILDFKIEEYKKENNIDVALSRILIRNTFRSKLEDALK